jgi:hypothetical protein
MAYLLLLFIYLLTYERRLTVVESDVSALKADVSELKSDVSELKTDVSVLKTDVLELKSDVSVLKTDVTALKANFVSGFMALFILISLGFAGSAVRSQEMERKMTASMVRMDAAWLADRLFDQNLAKDNRSVDRGFHAHNHYNIAARSF